VFLPRRSPPCPPLLKDTVGELTDGPDPSPTPPLRGEGLSGSPFPCREGGWGVRFSEFASGILKGGEFRDIAWGGFTTIVWVQQ